MSIQDLRTVLPPDAFETFIRCSIFDKTAFCLGEKEGMLVSIECGSWYNRVGDFKYQFGIGENSYCIPMDQHAWPDKSAPLLRNVWSMALSAMMVECEQFIYLWESKVVDRFASLQMLHLFFVFLMTLNCPCRMPTNNYIVCYLMIWGYFYSILIWFPLCLSFFLLCNCMKLCWFLKFLQSCIAYTWKPYTLPHNWTRIDYSHEL